MPNSNQLLLRLLGVKKCGRITGFFKPRTREIYNEIIQIIRAELERIQDWVKQSSVRKLWLYPAIKYDVCFSISKDKSWFLHEAFNDIRNQILKNGIVVTSINEPEKISRFARQVIN
jgi:hypothetical protein